MKHSPCPKKLEETVHKRRGCIDEPVLLECESLGRTELLVKGYEESRVLLGKSRYLGDWDGGHP